MGEKRKIRIRKVHLKCNNELDICAYNHQEGLCLKKFVDDISSFCRDFKYYNHVDVTSDEITVDLLILYHHIQICVAEYVQDSNTMAMIKNDMPHILKQSRTPIGVIIDNEGNYYVYQDNDPILKLMSSDQIAKLLLKERSEIPLSLDLSRVKETLLKVFDSSEYFPNKAKAREVYVKACDGLVYSNGLVNISEKDEFQFFRMIIGTPDVEYVCRYTSLESLFQILKNKTISMNGIASMNDPSEGNYADMCMPWYVNRDRWDWKSELNEVAIDNDNRAFLLCCCDETQYDDLTMWRLYGDDTKGVCMKFAVDESKIDNNRFYISSVNYGKKDGSHPELGLIRDLCSATIAKGWHFGFQQWYFWKYYFKPYEYSTEKEVRLVFFPNENDPEPDWYFDSSNGIFNKRMLIPIYYDNPLGFPLSVEEILLGPKSPNADKNVEQIWLMGEYMIDRVRKSKINNYR